MSIPKKLKEKIDAGSCAVFVGAGFSALSGLPSWRGLLEGLLRWAEESGLEIADRPELEEALGRGELLLVAEELLDQIGLSRFRAFMTETFSRNGAKPTAAHSLLAQLSFTCALTTNYDDLLETAYTLARGSRPRVLTHKEVPELAEALNSSDFYVLKAHGTIERIDTVILTKSHYRDLIYSNSAYTEHLKTVFLTRTLLFLGFGLTDPDLLALLDEIRTIFKGPVGEHFALLPDAEVTSLKKKMFARDYGIQLLTYESLGLPAYGLLPFLEMLRDSLAPAPAAAPAPAVADARGIRRLDRFLRATQVVLPFVRQPLTLEAAAQQGRLKDRRVVDEMVDEIVSSGTALIAGPPGSGKTVVGIQVAAVLRARVKGSLEAYYCPATELYAEEEESFLDTVRGPALVVIDDVHEDETNACDFLQDWRDRRDDGAAEDVFLLFLSQTYYSEDDSLRTSNIFHHHRLVFRALPSREEFADLVEQVWHDRHEAAIPAAVLRQIVGFCRNSPSLLAHAVEVASAIAESGVGNEQDFHRRLLEEVRKRYSLSSRDAGATRASLFGLYRIRLQANAFGREEAQRLEKAGFLVRNSGAPEYLNVVSPQVAELWQTAHPFERGGAWEVLSKYVSHPESNYHEVLLQLRRAGHFGLLRKVINNSFAELKDKLAAETDLYHAAVALECTAAVRRRLASLMITESLQRASLPLRLTRYPHPPAIARYLNVVTHQVRGLFVARGSLDRKSTVDNALKILAGILAKPATPLNRVGDICEAVARSSRDSGKLLFERVVKERGLSAGGAARGGLSSQEGLLNLAGRVAWFASDLARELVGRLDPAELARALLSTTRARQAQRLIRSVSSLNNYAAIRMLDAVLDSTRCDPWLEGMTSQNTNLYDLGSLLSTIGKVSRRIVWALVQRMRPHLERAIKNDPRLSPLGYLLATIKNFNGPVARGLLDPLSRAGRLTEMLDGEHYAYRFGRTILSIARIHRHLAARYLQSLKPEHWDDLIGRARNLTDLAVFLRGVAFASVNPDAQIEQLLDRPALPLRLEELGKEVEGAEDLTAYVAILAASESLSDPVKERLLRTIDRERFLRLIKKEEAPRSFGEAVRAYAMAFPGEVDGLTLELITDPDPELDLRQLAETGDVSAVGFLLQSAAEVDGRLGDHFGTLVREGRLFRDLADESRPARAAECLMALSVVAPIKAQKLVKQLWGETSPGQVLEECSDLREAVLLLSAIRASHQGFYHSWMNKALNMDDRERAKIRNELLSRCAEEPNLGILAGLLSVVQSINEGLARDILGSFNLGWIEEVARFDNQATQTLQFVTTAYRVASPATKKFLVGLLRETRLDDVSSVRALGFCLLELYRAIDTAGAQDAIAESWASVRASRIQAAVGSSSDLVGIATLAFLLTRLKDLPTARSLAAECERVVRANAFEQRIFPALVALALAGAAGRRLEQMDLGRKLADARLGFWGLGFVNWLAEQRAIVEKLPAPGAPLLSGDRIAPLLWDINPERYENEYRKVGGNLRFAFAALFPRQVGLLLPSELSRFVREQAEQRSRSEGRFRARNLLLEAAGKGVPAEQKAPLPAMEAVVLCVRDLAPRCESLPALGLGGEERATGLFELQGERLPALA